MKHQNPSGKIKGVLGLFAAGILCSILILVGIKGMITLASMKRQPEKANIGERPVQVEAICIQQEDMPVVILGHGQVKSLKEVNIAPEVSGKIVTVHANLKVGGIIPKGEVLFQIDPRDSIAACKEEQAAVEQWKNSISRIETEWEINLARQKTIERNRDLAKMEFERILKLFKESNIGTRSQVDASEKAYNSAQDSADQMRQTVALYPIQKRDAQNSLNAAMARLAMANARLDRCTVSADFDGRIKEVELEIGQYVTAGKPVVILADDSILEILVPLDSRDVRQWLKFKPERGQQNVSWFHQLDPVPCRIQWTEDRQGHSWEGYLHQVTKFDQQTRTVTVAVRIQGEKAGSNDGNGLPLVEGMFCSVHIPGKVMHDIIRIPRQAVTYNNFVYVSVDNRLKAVAVNVIRTEGEVAFVDRGLSTGDLVVTTRLVNPLENTLLEITKQEGGELES